MPRIETEETPDNRDPVAQDDRTSTEHNTAVTVGVLANDTDPDGDMLAIVSANSADGDVMVNGDGTLTFTPRPGHAGEATVFYVVSDGNGGTDQAVLTVEVAAGEVPQGPDGIVSGTDLDDMIALGYTGDPDGDTIDAGDAILPGEAPDDDIVEAGAGDDLVEAGAGNDDIFGGAGNDQLFGQDGDDMISGGDGDDTLDGGMGNDELHGGDGPDRIFGSFGDDRAFGGGGNDFIVMGDGSDYVEGGDGADEVLAGDGNDRVLGGAGNDTLDGQTDADHILGEAGDDTIIGGHGNDYIEGGTGDDIITGGEGVDILHGDEGDDTIDGGTGNDVIYGGPGADTLLGDMGWDAFYGATSGDVVIGGEDPDLDGDGESDEIDTLDLTGTGFVSIDYVVGDREAGTVSFGDGTTMTFSQIENVVPCFTPGTLIATPSGERRVEDLREGDRVLTRDNGIQEIAWVGAKALTARQLVAHPDLRPILIRAGALGGGLPERDMLVSPQHRVLVADPRSALYFNDTEVLAAAKHLTGADGIGEVNVTGVSYIHFMCARHEVVLSNGSWTESFQPGDHSLKGIGAAQRAEIYALFPELERREGVQGYAAARRALKKHEARLLVRR